MSITDMLQPSGFLIASLIVTYFILKPKKTYKNPYDEGLKYIGFKEYKKLYLA